MADAECPVGGHGGGDTAPLAREGVYYCRRCRHGWAALPDRRELYESDYFSGLEEGSPAMARWMEGRYAEVLAVAGRFHSPSPPGAAGEAAGSRVMDVGCGLGEFLAFLNARGVAAEGVEPSRRYSRACRERGLRVHTGYASDLEGTGRAFDLVTALHVLEHAVEPAALARSLRALCRPGGIVYVEVPNHLGAWRSRVKRLAGRPRVTPESLGRSGDRQCFSPASLRRVMEAAGLAVLRLDTRDYVEPDSSAWKRAAVAVGDLGARGGLLEGNVIRCWCRAPAA